MYVRPCRPTGEISNGIDIWQKARATWSWINGIKTAITTPTTEKGSTAKVGRTLGAGAMAPYLNDTVWLGNNFVESGFWTTARSGSRSN